MGTGAGTDADAGAATRADAVRAGVDHPLLRQGR
jgi:hypothetical protein